MKGAQTLPWVNAPRLDNVRVIVKVAHYNPGVLHTFNVGDTLPTASMSKYASHMYSMLAGLMSEAFVRHSPMAYSRKVWPRVSAEPLLG
jgi:hypothetical protein